jgi:hypothetical protein
VLTLAAGIANLGLGRLVATLFVGVSPFDPLANTAVPLFLALIALLASALVALPATRVDPMVARCE